jgi:hypothetical protein
MFGCHEDSSLAGGRRGVTVHRPVGNSSVALMHVNLGRSGAAQTALQRRVVMPTNEPDRRLETQAASVMVWNH